ARQGMNAQQTAIQIASQNISNASNTGYSRQSVSLVESQPTLFPYGEVGTGVDVSTITRARDTMLDTSYRQSAGAQSNADATSGALGQIQDIFGEPTDTGLSSTMDAFWSSWSTLAQDPTNGAAKAVVIQSGNNVASTLNSYASQLDQLDQNNRETMNADVAQVNSLSSQIADLNRQIVTSQSNGQPANDLLDQRDNALDQMSQLIGGQIVYHANGSVAVYAGSRMVLDDTSVSKLEVQDGQPPIIAYQGGAPALDGIGGKVGGELKISATTIPNAMSKLDSIASTLVTTVNSIHSSGQTFSGTPPVGTPAGNFFAVTNPPPTGTDPLMTARGIRLQVTDPSQIATASGTATGPGNVDVANQLAGLQDNSVAFSDGAGNSLGTASFDDFYGQLVGDVATQTRQAQDDSTVQASLASNADTRRQSVSGVSTDEELINVIQFQHAYQAAARLVTVADEMAQTLIQLGQ
ncbi:MAG TPA: flagellar hook-associated protein FlgK, partial [Gemmatimonadaceae bacterium]